MEPYRFTFNRHTEQIEHCDPWPKSMPKPSARVDIFSHALSSSGSFSSSESNEASVKHLEERKFTKETDAHSLTRPSRQSLRLAIKISRKEAEQLNPPRDGDKDFSETPALSSGLPTSEEEGGEAPSIKTASDRKSKKRVRSPSFAEPEIEPAKKARTLLSSEKKKEEIKKDEPCPATAAGHRIMEGLEKLKNDQDAFLAMGQQVGSLIETYQYAFPQTSLDARQFQIEELTPRQRLETFKELVPQALERMVGEFIETKRADAALQAELQERIHALQQENERLREGDAGGFPTFYSDFATDDFFI